MKWVSCEIELFRIAQITVYAILGEFHLSAGNVNHSPKASSWYFCSCLSCLASLALSKCVDLGISDNDSDSEYNNRNRVLIYFLSHTIETIDLHPEERLKLLE